MIVDCDIRFQAPFTALIAGPSQSGKSFFAFNLIKYRKELIRGDIGSVLYCLPEGQKIKVPDFIESDQKVVFHEGLPDFEEFNSGDPILIIIDDMMSDTNSKILNLFTRHSHHRNLSIMFIVQNIFFGGSKLFRTISLNCQYICVLKNPRDYKQIEVLGGQVSSDSKFVKEAYEDATQKPHTYLLFDVSQSCPNELRVRANIFPCDNPQNIIYISSPSASIKRKRIH